MQIAKSFFLGKMRAAFTADARPAYERAYIPINI